MNIIIYHNPLCSKSRKTLEIIKKNGIEPKIIEYLNKPPDAVTIEHLASLLELTFSDLLRKAETEFTTANDLPSLHDNAALAKWIREHPKVLQRPIVVDDDRNLAVVGRPPENVLELIKNEL